MTKEDQKILVSPDNPGEFIHSLRAAIEQESAGKERIDEIFKEAGIGGQSENL